MKYDIAKKFKQTKEFIIYYLEKVNDEILQRCIVGTVIDFELSQGNILIDTARFYTF